MKSSLYFQVIYKSELHANKQRVTHQQEAEMLVLHMVCEQEGMYWAGTCMLDP